MSTTTPRVITLLAAGAIGSAALLSTLGAAGRGRANADAAVWEYAVLAYRRDINASPQTAWNFLTPTHTVVGSTTEELAANLTGRRASLNTRTGSPATVDLVNLVAGDGWELVTVTDSVTPTSLHLWINDGTAAGTNHGIQSETNTKWWFRRPRTR